MLSDGTDVTIRETDTDHTACNCCGKLTTVVSGALDVGEQSAGWYTVGVTLDAPNHLPLCRLYIGDWTETAGPTERWGVRIGIAPDGPHLLDWSKEEQQEAQSVFTPLNRQQVLGTPLEPQLWELVDRIMTQDTRL